MIRPLISRKGRLAHQSKDSYSRAFSLIELLGLKRAFRAGQSRFACFTLIECTPSKGRDYLYVESTYPANYPIRAGSLTSAEVERSA